MTRHRVITLLLAVLTLLNFKIGRNDAADCSTFQTESVLNVPEGGSCDLTTDITVDEVNILGQIKVPKEAAKLITIRCTTFSIEAGGRLDLVGSGHGKKTGPGAGTADGSGGE